MVFRNDFGLCGFPEHGRIELLVCECLAGNMVRELWAKVICVLSGLGAVNGQNETPEHLVCPHCVTATFSRAAPLAWTPEGLWWAEPGPQWIYNMRKKESLSYCKVLRFGDWWSLLWMGVPDGAFWLLPCISKSSEASPLFLPPPCSDAELELENLRAESEHLFSFSPSWN